MVKQTIIEDSGWSILVLKIKNIFMILGITALLLHTPSFAAHKINPFTGKPDLIGSSSGGSESTTVSDTTTVDLTLTGSNIKADGLYTAGDFITLTGADLDVDTAAVTNGDTTHLSSADAIYDFVTGLNYITAAGVPAAETDAAHDNCSEITGCVVGAITSAGVPAAETDAAHDNCSEITGCVVGALTAETDPQVGTLTNTKWCTTDGTDIDCTTDAPSGTGDVAKVGTPADNQVGVWTGNGTIEGSNSFIFDGTNVGIGTLLPLSVLEARGATGLTISGQENLSLGGKCSANIAADAAAALSVSGCRYYSFTSNNATSTSRTFCLLAGTEGQLITLFADVSGTNEIELGDGAAGACAGSTGAATFLAGVWPAATNQNNDVATIIYRTTASGAAANGWYEIHRAAN